MKKRVLLIGREFIIFSYFMNTNNQSKIGIIFIAVIIFLLLAAIGYWGYNRMKGNKPASSITEVNISSAPTEPPTATPAPVDRTAFSIKVANGSGVAGEAKKMQTFLEEEGFKVSGTGNAAKTDYTDTIIQGADDQMEFMNELKTSLEKQYSAISIEKSSSESADVKDVTIIIGKDSLATITKAEEASDEATTKQ